MKNKNLHLITLGFSLFRERFLAHKTPPEVAAETAEIERKETVLFEKINAVLKPAKALKFEPDKNPYSTELDAFVKTLPDLSVVTFENNPEKKDGKLVLKYEGGAKTLTIEGAPYKAIFWEEISTHLETLFPGKNIPAELLVLGAESGNVRDAAKYNELVDKVAKEGVSVKATDPLVAEALKELEALREKLNPQGKRQRALLESAVAQSRVKMQIELQRNEPQLPNKPKLNKSQFLELGPKAESDLDEGPDKLNIARRGVLRDQLGIDPRDWDVTTQNALNKVFIQWRHLGINVDGDPFYQTLFFILKDRLDKRPSLVEDQRRLFEDPENHLNELEKIDEEYVVAFKHFLAIKTKISKEVTDSEKVHDLQQGKGGVDKVIDKTSDFFRKNYNEFARSIREHDYATAGVYLLGIYALYKTYSHLTEGVDGAKYKKYLFYGLAAGAGLVFAKNAGYDLLKMAGFKYKDAEIAGTSLDIVTSLDLKEAQDLNSGILLKLADIRVKDLAELYTTAEASNDPVKIIPPDQFPQLFPNLRNKRGTKEYTETGHDIYVAVRALKAAYRKTLERKTGLSFEEACKKDPVLEMATVHDLCLQMDLYSPGRNAPSLLDFKKFEKAKEKLGKAFESTGKSYKFEINRPDDKGVMSASVLNLPVVVVYNAAHERYRFYYKNTFKDGKSGEEAFGEISEDGVNSRTEAGQILDKVNARMDFLAAKLVRDGYSKPTFDGRDWTSTKDLEAKPKLGLPKETETFIVNPNHDGTALTVEMRKMNMSVMMDEGLVSKSPDSLRLLIALLGGKNPKFKILSPFASAKMITVTDIDANAGTFKVSINEVNESFVIQYDTVAGEYDFADPTKEQSILKNPAFKAKLIELSTQDPRIVDSVGRFRGLLDQAPESYLMNFVNNVPKWFTEAKSGNWFGGVKLRHLDGSIAKKYTLALLEAQMSFMKSKMIVATEGSSTFTDMASKIENVKGAFSNQLLDVVNELARLVNKGENIPEDEYNSRVFNRINTMGCVSSQYKDWYSRFVHSVMDRLGGDDFRTENAKKAANVIGVFAYYTASIDDLSLDGISLNTAGPTTDEYIVKAKYVNYIVDQIGIKLTDDPNNIPINPEAWRLMSFEDFEKAPFASPEILARTTAYKTEKDYPQFDVANPQPDELFRGNTMPANMDQATFDRWIDAAGRRTDIEGEIIDRFDKAVAALKNENLDNLIGNSLKPTPVLKAQAAFKNGPTLSVNIGSNKFNVPRDKTILWGAYVGSGSIAQPVMLGLASQMAANVDARLGSYGGTVNTDLQDAYINDEVKIAIEVTIINNPACWYKVSVPRKLKAWWNNFKFSDLFN